VAEPAQVPHDAGADSETVAGAAFGRSGKRPRERPRGAAQRAGRAPPAPGDRPRPPWYPLPLSELLILVGAIGTVVGFTRGEAGRPALFAGIGAVALGTLEFSIREHLGGYRSHTVLLAFIPTVVVHTALSLLLAVLGASALVAGFAPLVVDGALFAFLFKLLRARFVDARRERTFTGRR
jgi:hypothetical protein